MADISFAAMAAKTAERNRLGAPTAPPLLQLPHPSRSGPTGLDGSGMLTYGGRQEERPIPLLKSQQPPAMVPARIPVGSAPSPCFRNLLLL